MISSAEWQEYVRSRRVFILGAGFSAAAGIPMTRPLLRDAMKMFAIECPGIYERVCNYARDLQWDGDSNEPINYESLSFSDLCTHLEFAELREYAGGERWSDAGSREKLALRFYLAKALVRATPPDDNIPELYLEFARQLNDGDIVVTFNWDILLERALEKIGRKYSYNFEKDHVKLCKLHGSINWRLGAPSRFGKPVNSLDWQPIGFTEGGLLQVDMFSSIRPLRAPTWDDYQPLGELQPFLVLPGYGKAFDVRSNAGLWYKPEFAFAATRDVFVIGLGLAPDDHFIRSFFLHTFPLSDRKTYVINPDPNAPSNYDFLLKRRKAELIQEPFSLDHVRLIVDRMNT